MRKVILPFIFFVSISFPVPLIPHYIMCDGFLRLFVVSAVSISTSLLLFYLVGLDSKEKILVNSFLFKFFPDNKEREKNE